MQLSRPLLRTGAALFAVGVVVGVFMYALIGADRYAIDPQVQNALVLAVGAVGAALLAALGAYWAAMIAGGVAASEGAATRRETRRLSLIDAKTDLVRRITVLGSRHAQEVANQVARRQELAGRPYEPLPTINATTAIENRVNELYTLGFQATADVAQQLLHALVALDKFAYVATPKSEREPIAGLPDEENLSFLVWHRVQLRVKTHMIDVSLTDEGTEHLVEGGTLPADYLDCHYRTALDELRPGATLAAGFRAARIHSSDATQS